MVSKLASRQPYPSDTDSPPGSSGWANITANGATRSSSSPASRLKSVTWNRCKNSSTPTVAVTKPPSSPPSTRAPGAGQTTTALVPPREPSIEWTTSVTGNYPNGPNGKTPEKGVPGENIAIGFANATALTFRMGTPPSSNMQTRPSNGTLKFRDKKVHTMETGPTG